MSKHTLGPSTSINSAGCFLPKLIDVLTEHNALNAYTNCQFLDVSNFAKQPFRKEK